MRILGEFDSEDIELLRMAVQAHTPEGMQLEDKLLIKCPICEDAEWVEAKWLDGRPVGSCYTWNQFCAPLALPVGFSRKTMRKDFE